MKANGYSDIEELYDILWERGRKWKTVEAYLSDMLGYHIIQKAILQRIDEITISSVTNPYRK